MLFDKKYIHLSTSLFFKLLINVFMVFYIAKRVTVADFGSFSIAFVVASLTTLCLDYGFNLKALVLTSKSNEEINEELSSMIFSKIILTIMAFFCFLLFSFLTSYDNTTYLVILILTASAVPTSFGNFYLNNFKIINRLDKEANGYIIQGSCLLIMLILNHYYGYNDIIYYALILLLVRFIYMTYGFLSFRETFFKLYSFDFKNALNSIKTAAPYGIHLILGTSIIYIDTFILSLISNLENVGLYQAGMRIIMASMLIAVIISDAFIPEISKAYKDKKVVTKKLSRLFEFILLFCGLTTITLYFYKQTIILLLFSEEYLLIESSILLVIAIIILRYIGIVPGIILTSYGKQVIRANAVVVSIIFSVVLNLILIPLYNIEGAFVASLLAHVVLNIIYVFYAQRTVIFTKNISLSLLISILIIGYSFQIIFFKDSKLFLLITILLNAIMVFVYFKIINRKNKNET